MAESDSDNTGTWVLLRDYWKLKLAEVHHPDLAERLVRLELCDGRRQHRYLDANGTRRQDALSGKFWMEVKIDIETSSAFRPAPPFPQDARVCLRGCRVGFAAIDMDGVYCIEVLVPHQCIVCPQPNASAVESAPPITSEPANVLMPTGMPGKPNLTSIVEEEAKRRLAAGEVWPTLDQFAISLTDWWEEKRKTYNQVQLPLSKKGIENALRALWHARNTKA